MSRPMKEHPSTCAIRNMLDRPGLQAREDCTWDSVRFTVSNDRGTVVLEVSLERIEGGILCGVIDRGKKRPYRQPFHYRDSTQGPLDKRDRQMMSSVSSTVRAIVAKHERPVDRTPEARDGLLDRIQQILDAFPDDAAEKIAEAISASVGADGMNAISGNLTQTLDPTAS
jgi:hypothetical protein